MAKKSYCYFCLKEITGIEVMCLPHVLRARLFHKRPAHALCWQMHEEVQAV